jgi:(p)ppGpp synthase/HD superfamily hydrolase
MARAFALSAYDSQDELEHPEEVRELVAGVGADDEVQAAALLHDLIEDTDTTLGVVGAEFGSRIAAIVSAMTEDESIEDYAARKQEHRLRTRDAGRDVALVFVADKLSNARRMRRGQKKPAARKLGHYAATLETMREAYPDLPLLDDLDTELRAVRAELERTSAG